MSGGDDDELLIEQVQVHIIILCTQSIVIVKRKNFSVYCQNLLPVAVSFQHLSEDWISDKPSHGGTKSKRRSSIGVRYYSRIQ